MGANFSLGRVYSQTTGAQVPDGTWITQPEAQAPPLLMAGSHKTHRHGITVEDFVFFL